MAKLEFTANGTKVQKFQKGGTQIANVQGNLGGGVITLQYQSEEMKASNDWATVTNAVNGTLVPLVIDTVDRPIQFPLGAVDLRATLSGATAPNCRLYVDVKD